MDAHVLQEENFSVLEVVDSLAGCWAGRAATSSQEDERARWLIEARFWDPDHPEMIAMARPLARQFQGKGERLMADKDWQAAYLAFKTAVELDPRLSTARRDAEHCRDERLGIKGKGDRTFADSFINKHKSRKPSKTNHKTHKGRTTGKRRPSLDRPTAKEKTTEEKTTEEKTTKDEPNDEEQAKTPPAPVLPKKRSGPPISVTDKSKAEKKDDE